VGAGFGGLSLVRALRNAPVQISLVDRHNYHLFQPLLYQVATAGLSSANISTPIRTILRNQDNVQVFMSAVHGVDRVRQRVLMDGLALSYDTLVLATGAQTSYFGKDEWTRSAPGLKDVEDAFEIRERVLSCFERAELESESRQRERLLTFVVVGGGPTGVELAGSFAELARFALASDFRHIDTRSARILLLEAGPQILPTFAPELSQSAARMLHSMGVEVMTGARVRNIAEGRVEWTSPDGTVRILECGATVWAAGVRATGVAEWLGVSGDRSGRVTVDDQFTIPGDPRIFVIGDACLKLQDGRPLPGLAPVAMQEGRFVARVIEDRLRGVRTEPFRYRDRGNLATVGRKFAIGEFGRVRLQGGIAWLVWTFIHVYYLIGFRNRLIVLLEWAWAYVTYQRGARIILKAIDESAEEGTSRAAPERQVGHGS